MAARLHPLDHQRIDARAHQLLRERKGRREADDLRARGLDRLEAALGWQAPCEHDMADAMFCAHLDQLEELRSEEHTSELQSLMRISYAVFCLKKKINRQKTDKHINP